MAIAFTVNGEARRVEAPETATLLDGQPAYACTREVGTVADRKVATIEGLGSPASPHPLQQAFLDEQAGQCGYCLAGILISAKALLDKNPKPSRAEIAQ